MITILNLLLLIPIIGIFWLCLSILWEPPTFEERPKRKRKRRAIEPRKLIRWDFHNQTNYLAYMNAVKQSNGETIYIATWTPEPKKAIKIKQNSLSARHLKIVYPSKDFTDVNLQSQK
jgi:hypothetical protein